MSGRVIPFKRHWKESGNDSGDGSGEDMINSGQTTAELRVAAERDFFDHEGREKMDGRIRACMHVLLSEPEKMQERLREGLEMGGILKAIPQSAGFPMSEGDLVFRSEEDLRELTDEAMFTRLMTRHQNEKAEAIAAYRQWATELVEDLTLIAEARMSGVTPEDILTPRSLRMALATEMVSQNMVENIAGTRKQVRELIAALMSQSEAGVKAAPLAVTMKKIGQQCQRMNEDMDVLEKKALASIGNQKNGRNGKSQSELVSLTKRAKEVFKPFIQGNHIITMEQLRGLEGFLLEAGSYNENIGGLIEDGLKAIKKAKESGKHQEVRKIEGFLDFEQQLAGFERITRALDNNFAIRFGIVSNAGAQNRVVLKSTPPKMLKQAEAESGLLAKRLLGGGRKLDMNLVLSSNDDLKLRQV